MKREVDRQTEALALLANGTSRRWDIAVDESLERGGWSLEMDGPQIYLVFQLRDLDVIPKALQFLESGSARGARKRQRGEAEEAALYMGRFGGASVSLVWDNEDFPRCFLIVGPKARSTLRLSLESEDIRMLSEAFRAVLKDLSRPQSD
jgi:hypothetical protein